MIPDLDLGAQSTDTTPSNSNGEAHLPSWLKVLKMPFQTRFGIYILWESQDHHDQQEKYMESIVHLPH